MTKPVPQPTAEKWIAAVAVLVLLASPASAVTKKTVPRKTVKTVAKVTTTQLAAKATPSVSLEGTGTFVSSTLTMPEGVLTATMTHTGQSNFQVKVLDLATGKPVLFLANEIGTWSGVAVDGVRSAGQFLVEVSADGPWTIRIDYPRPVTGVALPQVLTGSGEAIAAVIQHTGAAKFTMTHSGSSNFQVKGFDPVRGVDLFLANEIGAWSGVKVAAMSGVRIIHVNADGPWTIRIEKP